jgi:small subunit ribosomal protein S5
MRGTTIIGPVIGIYGASEVVFRPAAPGSGLRAGGGVRVVLELAGVHDVLAKSVGSTNSHNIVKATFDAFARLESRYNIRALRRSLTGGGEPASTEARTA